MLPLSARRSKSPSESPDCAGRRWLTAQFREFLEAFTLMTSLRIKIWEAPEFFSCFLSQASKLKNLFLILSQKIHFRVGISDFLPRLNNLLRN